MPTFRLVSLGCKVSRTDAASMTRALERAGFARAVDCEPADLCLVCGCAVTVNAEGKSRRAIRRLARENDGALVVAAGCIARRESSSRDAGAELLVPPGETDGIVGAVRATGRFGALFAPQKGASHVPRLARPAVQNVPGDQLTHGWTSQPWHTRAFLKVQDGCGGECSYCIVPKLRGPPRSRPAREVIEEARTLVDAGHAEIVLTGIRLGAYGRDAAGAGKSRLVDLVQSLLELRPPPCGGSRGLVRLRLSSIEPVDFDMRLADIASSGGPGAGLCPHFHLPLQSADDEVLSRMNRPYTTGDYISLLARIRERIPDASITTDVIAGFPGETPEAHARTVSYVREAGFARVHAFPFSPRPGTAAYDMPRDPSTETARERARELIKEGKAAAREYRSRFIGRELEVIAEPCRAEAGPAFWGYTDRYVRVSFAGPDGLAGRLVRVRATGEAGDGLDGEVAQT